VRAPCQPVVKKGSVVVRDLRLWHGGCPNLSEVPRVMLAMSEFFLFLSSVPVFIDVYFFVYFFV
jgi:ectoine hydroxylase-related dioxygenase (phytanoyl-CoA dioxygenase family)